MIIKIKQPTVEELIRALWQMPLDAEVYITDVDYPTKLDRVMLTENRDPYVPKNSVLLGGQT
jgi:hypothetical protein